MTPAIKDRWPKAGIWRPETGSRRLMIHRSQPGTGDQRPVTIALRQATDIQIPTISSQQPENSVQQPVSGSPQTAARNAQPATRNSQLASSIQQPAASSQNAASSSPQPVPRSLQPAFISTQHSIFSSAALLKRSAPQVKRSSSKTLLQPRNSQLATRIQHPVSGFTLLEVLIAMAIMAIVLVSVYRMHSQTLTMTAASRFYTQAPMLAQSKLSQLEANPSEVVAGDSGDFGEQFPGYSWSVSAEDVSSEVLGETAGDLKRVELTVSLNEKEYEYSVRTYLFVGESN